jgi:aldose 1-epimerase
MSILKHDVLALSDGIARCDVVPQAGGAIAGFWWECGERRIDWLRPARAADVARADVAKMAAYPLVPWGGRIRDGSFHFGGEEVAEGCDALNGHGWRRSWRVVGRSATEAALEYRHDGGSWPWPYRARQTVALAAGALSLTLDLANESDRLMPAGLGFLSAFPFASEASLEAAVQGVWPEDGAGIPREGRAVPSPCGLACAAEEAGDPVFTGWDGSAAIAWPGRGMELRLAADWPLLSFLAVRRSAHLSVAPMSHCVDAFNLARAGVAGTGVRVLAPGASRSATVKLVPHLSRH